MTDGDTLMDRAQKMREAAAQHHDRHADGYARMGLSTDEAVHRRHAALAALREAGVL